MLTQAKRSVALKDAYTTSCSLLPAPGQPGSSACNGDRGLLRLWAPLPSLPLQLEPWPVFSEQRSCVSAEGLFPLVGTPLLRLGCLLPWTHPRVGAATCCRGSARIHVEKREGGCRVLTRFAFPELGLRRPSQSLAPQPRLCRQVHRPCPSQVPNTLTCDTCRWPGFFFLVQWEHLTARLLHPLKSRAPSDGDKFYVLTLHPDSLLAVFQNCSFYSLFSRISRYTVISSTNGTDLTSFSFLFRATPAAYGGSQAREPIRAVAARSTPKPQRRQIRATSVTHTTAHGNTGSLTHGARPGMEPASSWILVGFVTTE